MQKQALLTPSTITLLAVLSQLLVGCGAIDNAANTSGKTLIAQPPATENTGDLIQSSNDVETALDESEEENSVDISHRYQYKVRGKQYKVFSTAGNFQEIGIASWYGPGFHGKKTANGEKYNMHAMTAAHKTLPLGSWVRVTNLVNKRVINLRINDRGPFHNGRIIDLSKEGARRLGILKHGFAKVHVRAIPKPN